MKKLCKWVSRIRLKDIPSNPEQYELSYLDMSSNLCLYNLPEHVLEIICQLLIDDAPITKNSPGRTFRQSLLPIMYLRASCVHLSHIIVNLVLKLDGEVTIDWTDSPDMVKLVDFMRNRTNWRFRSLKIKPLIGFEASFDYVSILSYNEILFRKSVKRFILCLPSRMLSQSYLRRLLDWLTEVALTKDSVISVRFQYLTTIFPYPELVSDLSCGAWSFDFNRYNIDFQVISIFRDLTVLNIPHLHCDIVELKSFHKLKHLHVSSLSMTNSRCPPNFSNIESLTFCSPDREYFDHLPLITKLCFPCIIYFGFYEAPLAHLSREILDFSDLPSSCKFLKTNIEYLFYFAECKSIQNLNILFDVTYCRTLPYSPSTFLNVSLLNITFQKDYIVMPVLVPIVIFFLCNFRTVEVLCLDDVALNTLSSTPNIFKTMIEDRHCTSNQFSKEQTEIRQFCRDNKNLKVLSVGRTCWLKKTVSSAFLKELDDIAFSYNWDLIKRNSVLLPFEMLQTD